MPDEDTTDQTVTPADGKPPADLGDAGKRALESERSARREAEKQAKELAARLKELEDRDKSETDKLREDLAAKESALADIPRQVRQQVVRFASEATRMGFLDPEDALLNIDVDLGDSAAVTAALTDLAERKPHLVRDTKQQQRIPARPTANTGEPLGTAAGDASAKARAAAAMRQFRNS